jgi:hypothetical protein
MFGQHALDTGAVAIKKRHDVAVDDKLGQVEDAHEGDLQRVVDLLHARIQAGLGDDDAQVRFQPPARAAAHAHNLDDHLLFIHKPKTSLITIG